MLKKLTLIVVAASLCAAAMAQTPSFRSPGYKGSVSLTDAYGVWLGLETSQGYMFNSHHYLGAGVSGFMFPNGTSYPKFGSAFLDYQYYIKDAKNTPVLGFKTGVTHAFGYGKTGGMKFKNAFLMEPSVGWNWGLKNGKGFTTALAGQFFVPYGLDKSSSFLAMPKISFTFEF